ncbi:MAG: TlpA family protein disulfide reductase [Kiritimatiellae bacterium]|nr:TlpA family protein disulfide reductase [Kiritimatiellia bacterium]
MKHLLTLATLLLVASLQAVTMRNLNDDAHISGPKLTEKALEGRVIAIEVFGYQCPPCRASLPHMAKLADSYKKDARVAIIGSHCQNRDEPAILKLLKDNKCEYPVYQNVDAEGAPSAGGIPFAYVLNHKGEVVWQGNPYSKFGEMESAIAAAVKALPKLPPDSLLVGLDLQHCKDVSKRLVAGQNIESVLRQLQTRAARGGAAGKEAQAILDRCDEWAETLEGSIREAMETHPSRALSEAQLYTRTLPKRAAALKSELATLAKDPITQKLAASRAAFEKARKTDVTSTNIRKRIQSQAKMQLRQLATLQVAEDNEDFLEVKALWEDFADALSN